MDAPPARESGVLALGVPRPKESPRGPARTHRESLLSALARARAHLASLQRPDGAWEVDVDQGDSLLAALLVVERRLGVLTERDACAGARTLLASQRADGAFRAFPGARDGGLLASALAAAALHATRVPKARAAIARADAWVARSGGDAAILACFAERMDPSVLFLVAADRLDPAFLPEMPAEIVDEPFDRLVDRRAHPGNVLGMVVLSALREDPTSRARLDAIRARIEALLSPNVTAEGGCFGWAWHTLTCLVGLAASGATAADPIVERALTFLGRHKRHDADGALRIAALGNDVLSTAHAVSALGDDAATRAASTKGAAFLVESQSRVVMPRPNQRKTGAPRTGGWSMHGENALFPDTDTTAAVVQALTRRRRRDAEDARGDATIPAAVRCGLEWMVGMQNPSGGFPTFVWDLSDKPAGPLAAGPTRLELDRPASVMHLLFDPPPELGDPAVEGVTGRVLAALGSAGRTRRDPVVARAISFLHHQQCDHGGFWGRWMTCYLAETATIVLGLAAVGEDTRAPWVERAVDFLLAHQNADGGWGELPDAYRDASLAGVGPSMPTVTGYVVQALLAVSDPPYEAIQAGVRYLLANQRDDGGWDNAGFLHVWLLPDHLYEYRLPALTAPTVALARYVERLEENVQLVSSTRRKRRLSMRARVSAAHRAPPP